ncbi:cytochrome c biogenesis protein/redoxin [Chakrabartyella piscis]|uniref:cytochrome c biogenesis protein/redoxin n=1 Tax=Chakrabartyella piscis TaxID=2918914 RepID=UPI0029583E71|nr:cytochrome c biogenesis protein/redoxin [Chakrabartyella piscis]
MNFDIETTVPILTVFIQGLLSFFSPCILPLVPLYISYLAGGTGIRQEDGSIVYPKKTVLINTIFFVLGISFAFFALGFGFTALGQFFNTNRLILARFSGIFMIFFGLYLMGALGKSDFMDKEHRIPFRLNALAMGPLPALLLGFTFSFAWTPCVGPILGSVLLMASSASSATTGYLLIGVYTLGFVLPFLATGVFTQSILQFFRAKQNILRYSVKIGALLLVLMGIMTATGLMNNLTGFLSTADFGTPTATEEEVISDEEETVIDEETITTEDASTEEDITVFMAPDFTLIDQYGTEHTLSDYVGKTVFLNFWATWCPPCQGEMPYIEELYVDYGYNEEDVIVLGVAMPNFSNEGDVAYITDFLVDNGYTFPVVMDETASTAMNYYIQSYPTTFMIAADGSIFGYVPGALTKDIMVSIVEQTKEAN